jgi:hypothetical protein
MRRSSLVQKYEKASASWRMKPIVGPSVTGPFPVAWGRGELFEGFHAPGIVSVISCDVSEESVTNALV